MIMLGLYKTKKVPFKNVYMHGMVRDKNNQKMSKSKGNVIDPLVMMDLHGTDALRMAMIIGNTPGSDCSITDEKIKGYKNFANKIWNVSRFVAQNTEGFKFGKKPTLAKDDQKYIKDFDKVIKEVTKNIESFKFYMAAEKIYHYFWHTFADVIIEQSKIKLTSKNIKEKQSAQWTILYILNTSLKLLHPFMPFVTEEIWMTIFSNKKANLIVEKWPTN
jgi:valyl-tRNA synthetase